MPKIGKDRMIKEQCTFDRLMHSRLMNIADISGIGFSEAVRRVIGDGLELVKWKQYESSVH